MVNILHAADFHMDSPFASLPPEKAAQRRREQRELLDRLAAQAEGADIVLLAGDLFDSDAAYWETSQTLTRVLASMRAQVFIAPGNHDYYTSRSPYAFMELPGNVHIFKSPRLRSIELPDLGVRVWGAGYSANVCEPLLRGFTVRQSDFIELGVLHADMAPDSRYCALTEGDIEHSGLDYLALGHVHGFSGIKRAGRTFWAYPGCLEGRGFDETGPKGVIKGAVGKGECDLRFVPIASRQYRTVEVRPAPGQDALSAARDAVGEGYPEDVARIVLRGAFPGEVDPEAIRRELADRFFHLTVKDEHIPARDVWDGAGEDTLTGMFLADLKAKYDGSADAESRELIELAARYGVSALEGREEWRQ